MSKPTYGLAHGFPAMLLLALMALGLMGSPAFAQSYRQPGAEARSESHYEESALRRFEIISLVSLPFTTIHSFLIVRGVAMAEQGKFSPKLSRGHFWAIGAAAVSSAALIGLYDWLNTRDKNISEPKIPRTPPIPGLDLSAPDEETRPRARGDAEVSLALLTWNF